MKHTYFLHIPKTAGQSVHNGIVSVLGQSAVSPIRVHTQVGEGGEQFPAGYSVYSGHLDWHCLEKNGSNQFVFSVLRDPRERIGSFYLFLRDEARRLSGEELLKAENVGKRKVLSLSADDYFFSGSEGWQEFILDHYDNFYTSYFASRKMRGRSLLTTMRPDARVGLASDNIGDYNVRIFSVKDLHALEVELSSFYEKSFNLSARRDNVGKSSRGSRWEHLISCFESDASAKRLERFVAEDMKLIERLRVMV